MPRPAATTVTIFVTVLLALFSFPMISNVFASRTAIVKSLKAVIYSDVSLKSPIGYARRGKQIQIGDKARRHGKVLPIYVSGRIGYIQTKDIAMSSTGKVVKKLKKQRVFEHKSFDRNSRLLFNVSQFDPGKQWNSLAEIAGASKKHQIISYKMFIEKHYDKSNLFWGIGAGYYTLEQERLGIEIMTLEGTLFWSPYKYKNHFALDIFYGGIFAPIITVKLKTDNERRNGNGFGQTMGGQIRFFHKKTYSLVAGIAHNYMVMNSITKLTFPNKNVTVDKVNVLYGYNLYGGLAIRF